MVFVYLNIAKPLKGRIKILCKRSSVCGRVALGGGRSGRVVEGERVDIRRRERREK